MGIDDSGLIVKQSRISFFYNYVIVALVAFLFILVWMRFDLTFSLFPQSVEAFWHSLVVLGFAGIMVALFEEPVIQRWFRHYVITNSEVIMTEGVLRKNRISIPYQSVSNIDVYKSILGRIFNFGDIKVVGFRNMIDMKGIREPEVFYKIINNKISIMRGTKRIPTKPKKKKSKKKKKKKSWREREKKLRKDMKKRKSGSKELPEVRVIGGEEEKA